MSADLPTGTVEETVKENPVCTEPGRWEKVPDLETPDDESLAYFAHAKTCSMHRAMVKADDAKFDREFVKPAQSQILEEMKGSFPELTKPKH